MAVYSSAGFPPCALWDFSLKLYSEETVSEACLALQARVGIDVNLILFCIWIAASGRETLTDQELEDGLSSTRDWQIKVVNPLRDLRRYLKSPEGKINNRLANDLRRVIADSELYSEKLELQMLGNLIDRPVTSSFGGQDCADAAAQNLVNYMAKQTDQMTDLDRNDLCVIWQAAFPSADLMRSVLAKDQAEMEL